MCGVYPDLPGKHLYECVRCSGAIAAAAEGNCAVDGTGVGSEGVGGGDETAGLELPGGGFVGVAALSGDSPKCSCVVAGS